MKELYIKKSSVINALNDHLCLEGELETRDRILSTLGLYEGKEEF